MSHVKRLNVTHVLFLNAGQSWEPWTCCRELRAFIHLHPKLCRNRPQAPATPRFVQLVVWYSMLTFSHDCDTYSRQVQRMSHSGWMGRQRMYSGDMGQCHWGEESCLAALAKRRRTQVQRLKADGSSDEGIRGRSCEYVSNTNTHTRTYMHTTHKHTVHASLYQ